MGPKKEISRPENARNVISINDPVNTDSWKCVVMMAVERTSPDSFVLKNFMEEAASGRRSEIKVIHFQDLILNTLKDFTMGELPFKYAFLLNFSSIFKDAAEYYKNKSDIPLQLLVKVVKAFLFYLREENLQRIERKVSGPLDPVKAMSERPTNVGNFDSSKTKVNLGKKKEATTAAKSKQTVLSSNIEAGLKIRPPSVGKLNTKLLKRGETSKQDQWIDDAPSNSFFNLYILLTGFYNPKFPLELIRTQIPLHSILCIDSSSLIIKGDVSATQHKVRKHSIDDRSFKIQQFWDDFLDILWDPYFCNYFKETIFQIFEPQAVICDKKNLKDFIYREISFLMYDLTDYKRQHINYLSSLKLWNVKDERNSEIMKKYTYKLDSFPCECLTVPIILNSIIDVVEGNEKLGFPFEGCSYNSIDLDSPKLRFFEPDFSHSILPKIGPSNFLPPWRKIIRDKGNLNCVKVYSKIKALDKEYNVEGKNYHELSSKNSEKSRNATPSSICHKKNQIPLENYQNGLLYSLWKKLRDRCTDNKSFSINLDVCLYPYLMTKIVCPYLFQNPLSSSSLKPPSIRSSLSNKTSNYRFIENIKEQMHKPHFTVTQGTRSALKCFPHNVKESAKDFFCPSAYKIVTPEAIKVSSAPEFRVPPQTSYNICCLSDLVIPEKLMEEIDWNVYQNLEKFLGNSLFLNANNFDLVEELSSQKLVRKDLQIFEEYNCIDHIYSILTDSVLVALHNRKNENNIYRETFNRALKTKIGLRDFFEYILEDEMYLCNVETKSPEQGAFIEGNNINKNSDSRKDSSFWSEKSIKFDERLKSKSILKEDLNSSSSKELSKKKNPGSSYHEKIIVSSKEKDDSMVQEAKGDFFQVEGYDIEDVAVQFSGLKTIYYAQGCTLNLELIEKLYGSQTLGVHIRQGGHTLHLYSYVCPTPHLPFPYACHFMCNNGIILAFGKRTPENFEYADLNESPLRESEISLNRLKNSFSQFSMTEKENKNIVSPADNEEDNVLDLKLSTPNGLIVETVNKIGKPFYIKQRHLFKARPKHVNNETCRLFLPNKNLVKIMKNGTVEILKADTSIGFASLADFGTRSPPETVFNEKRSQEANGLTFTRYDFIDSRGGAFAIQDGKIKTSGKFQIFQSTNLQSQQIFFRRKDGTSYIINGDGALCVQFQDGTKMCSTPFTAQSYKIHEDVLEKDENFFLSNFVFIYEEITFEHPSYATVVYNTLIKKWKIILPSDLSVTVEEEGNYFTKIDNLTHLNIRKNLIEMKRLSPSGEWLGTAMADLSVFEKHSEEKVYCKVDDLTGKSFVVESNSNCYVFSEAKRLNEENEKEQLPPFFEQTSNGSEDLIKRNGPHHQGAFTRGTKLCRDSKYFVVRSDLTGLEVIHKEDFGKILSELNDEDVIFTREIFSGQKLRCFILIHPECKTRETDRIKWKVTSILPDPKSSPMGQKRTSSSTYGVPPSWMHPFPKKKVKFKVPEKFTCRVFVETKTTEFYPRMGSKKLQFCQLDDEFQLEKDKIQWVMDNFQDYLKKISAENQELLRIMYISAICKLQEAKNNIVPIISENLKHFLAMNKYHLNLQEYHKRCVQNHLIPVYFHHPIGMCRLILYDFLTNLKFTKLVEQQRFCSQLGVLSSPYSISFCSNGEIEYNLSWRSEKSFSDLSYKSNLSARSSPLLSNKTIICTGQISSLRKTVSAPTLKLKDSKISSYENIQIPHETLCEFRESEIDFLLQTDLKLAGEQRGLTLQDIFTLGLI